MNIIRILTLYKQHYLRQYEQIKKGEYSCWGYYDSMDVSSLENHKDSRLDDTEGNINLTDLWYGMGERIIAQSGVYGQQNISLLRYESHDHAGERDELFWRKKEIFLCACMIQLREEGKAYEELIGKFESELRREDDQDNVFVYCIGYRTLDNADMILFIKSNSYRAVDECIRRVGGYEQVQYTHSVCGISQEYLRQMRDVNYDVQEVGTYDHLLKNDSLHEIALEITGNGQEAIEKYVGGLRTGGEWSGVLGRIDAIVSIHQAEMRQAIRMIGEETTHENPFYGGSIYNVTTNLKVDGERFIPQEKFIPGEGGTPETESEGERLTYWCSSKIEELKADAEEIKRQKNEMFYSYYQAMIQSLNMIAQYENSPFSRDVFRIVFPSLQLFYKQLDESVKTKAGTPGLRLGELKKEDIVRLTQSISHFLESLDSLIYHMVHTDQNFLMIPGYGGALYDIPGKLCLTYMAYAGSIVDILNDSPSYRYECCLAPVVHSKPSTQCIDMNLDVEDNLIQINISQRCLFMPRSFCVILIHELAHYVGEATRCREIRLNSMVKILSYAIADKLFTVGVKESKEVKTAFSAVKGRKSETELFLAERLYAKIKREVEGRRQKYHFFVLGPVLKKACLEVLRDDGYELRRVMRREDETVRRMIEDCSGNLEGRQRQIVGLGELYRILEQNLSDFIIGVERENTVENMMQFFRDIYSDLAAVKCLNLDWQYYMEAFILSEGFELEEEMLTNRLINRTASVVNALNCQDRVRKERWEKLADDARRQQGSMARLITRTDEWIKKYNSKASSPEERTAPLLVEEETYPYRNAWLHQFEYLSACGEALDKLMMKRNTKVNRIRQFFEMFLKYPKGKDYSFKRWFRSLDQLIGEYGNRVDYMLKEDALSLNCNK